MAKCAVCFCKGSELTVLTDLVGAQQMIFAALHPHPLTKDKLCTPCVLLAIVPFLCDNNTKNNSGCNTSIPTDH